MEPGEFERALVERGPLMSALGATVERILRELLAEADISTLSITHRVKDRDSALRKFAKRPEVMTAVDNMTDVVGLRVITYLRDEVDEVAKVVEREFDIDVANSVDKRTLLDPDRFGYLSLHYVASLSESRTAITEYKKFEGVRFELQIRSVLQHAWAEIEHDLGYKSSSAVPREERRAFSRLAGLLEMADDEFVRIRDRLAAHRESTESEIARGDREIEIDQDSVFAFLVSGDMLLSRMDRAIAEFAVGEGTTNAEPTREYAGSRAMELRDHGFQTLGAALRALATSEGAVLDYARRWLQDDFPAAAELPVEPTDFFSLADFEALEDDSGPVDFSESSSDDFEGWDSGEATVYRSTPEQLAALTWSRGVSLFYLHRYLNAQQHLALYLASSSWDERSDMADRASAACLAAARGLPAVPLD